MFMKKVENLPKEETIVVSNVEGQIHVSERKVFGEEAEEGEFEKLKKFVEICPLIESSDDEDPIVLAQEHYDSVSGLSVEDMFKSVSHKISHRYCVHQRVSDRRRCVCMSGLLFDKSNRSKYILTSDCIKDLICIIQEIRLADFLNQNVGKLLKKYEHHKVVLTILCSKDVNLANDPYMSRAKFMRYCYELRALYGSFENRGEMIEECNDFEAQQMPAFLSNFIEVITDLSARVYETSAQVIEVLFGKIMEALSAVFSVLSEGVSKMFTKLFGGLKRKIIEWIDPVGTMATYFQSDKKTMLIMFVCCTLVIMVIDIVGFLTYKLLTSFIGMMVDYFEGKVEGDGSFVAQSPVDPVAGVISVIGIILGLTAFDLDVVGKKCRSFIAIISAGLGSSWLLGSLFLVLPTIVQTAIKTKFGTAEEKEKAIIDDWLLRASAVIKLKRISKVLVSDEYYKWLSELVNDANGLKCKIKTPTVSGLFVRNLTELMNIISILENYRKEKSFRDYPFSIHMCADPGYGKTLISSCLVRDLFGVVERDIYTRPVSSEFWDGFIDQKVIILDEFLIGDSDTKLRHAQEYLELVSTKSFKPNLASIDNPAVGLKGTRAEPVGVLTINNKEYEKCAHVSNAAMWRRRELVIKCRINPSYRDKFVDNKVELARMSDDELANKSWLLFDILPREFSSDQGKVEGLNYNDMMCLLKDKYEAHVSVCERLRSGQNLDDDDGKSPSELLEDALRELQGVSNEPIGVGEAFTSFFTGKVDDLWSLFSQGPSDHERMNRNVGHEDIGGVWKDKDLKNLFRRISRLTTTKKTKEWATEAFPRLKENLDRLKKDENIVDYFRVEKKLFEKMKDFGMTSEMFEKYVASDSEDGAVGGVECECESSNESVYDDAVEKIRGVTMGLPLPVQKDVDAYMDHSNVDAKLVHRHVCLGIAKEARIDAFGVQFRDRGSEDGLSWNYKQCGRHFAHKHDDYVVHKMLCADCVRNGNEENAVSMHGGFLSSSAANFVKTSELIPDDYDFKYNGCPEEFANRMNEKWMSVYLSKFVKYGQVPVLLFRSDTHGDYSFAPRTYFRKSAKITAAWVAFGCMMFGLRRIFKKREETVKEDYEICFSQSAKPNKTTRPQMRVKNFVKGYAQGAGLEALTFTIGNVSHYGFPIRGQTFMTYLHAFHNENKLVPEGKMVVKYRTFKCEIDFKYSMLRKNEENDLCFVSFFDKKMVQFPNNVKRFWSYADFDAFDGTSAMLELESGSCYVNVVKALNKNYSHGERCIRLEECLLYKYPTKSGDCGVVLRSAGQLFPGKIMGMHVAGGVKNGCNYGVSMVVTREDVVSALGNEVDVEDVGEIDLSSQSPTIREINEGDGEMLPNLREIENIPVSDAVWMNRNSKIERSCLTQWLNSRPKKNKPILSVSDDRNWKCVDPAVEMMKDSLMIDHRKDDVDSRIVYEVFDDMLMCFKDKLVWPVGCRKLTFEEALMGIPGKLCSLKVNSSAGYPLCKMTSKKGKTEWFYFDANGDLVYNPLLKEMVNKFLYDLEHGKDVIGRFITHLKDELVSDVKIREGRTRVIYCGDLVANVAFRMLFGSLVCAINNSYETTSSAIGLNQYSHDMHLIYDYLTEVGENFIAGDFKNFDKNIQPEFQRRAYDLLMDLMGEVVSDNMKKNFVNHQMNSPAALAMELIYFGNMHFSGCFFTTIINNIVHEAYIRYIFSKVCGQFVFDECVRMKVLGDDHIYCVSGDVREFFRPFVLRDELKKLGQVYTSDIKECELVDQFRDFEDVTFLGAHPIMVNGKYCGALKKDTIYEMLHWTRNKNLTIVQEAKTAMEFSSIWDKEFYIMFCGDVSYAVQKELGVKLDLIGWSEMRKIVCGRTASSECGFPYGFFAQGPVENQHSIVDVSGGKIVEGPSVNVSMANKLTRKALNEVPLDINFGTNSNVYRKEFSWRTADVAGASIYSVDLPFGLLNLGNVENLQNMSFDRFCFWKGDVTITAQINATPFQCGLLAMYFVPLASYEVELSNITACQYVLIQPDQNATYSLTIPFVYLRSVMNTRARATESLGTVHFTPVSPLSSIDTEQCTITLFSSFPGSEFTIPRPLTDVTRVKKFYNVHGRSVDYERTGKLDFMSQGNTNSTTISNVYSNAGGDMPIQGGNNSASGSADIEVDADASIPMPFDNPPLCSGALPIQQTFSGMAASHGIRPTVDLQLKPAVMSRQQIEIFDPSDCKIQTICGKSCLLTSLPVAIEMVPGTKIYEIDLNTRLGIVEGSNIPLNIAALNQFMFWRGDVTFSVMAIITKYHSLRLQAVMAYGSSGLVDGSRNVDLSKIMNFSSNDTGTNYQDSWSISFNAQTEFLRTYEGEATTEFVQNYSLGTFGLFIQNALIAPDTVPPSIQILVFVKFENLKVAVPRPNGPFSWDENLVYTQSNVYTMNGAVRDPEIPGNKIMANCNPISPNKVEVQEGQAGWDVVPPDGDYVFVTNDPYAWVIYTTPNGTARVGDHVISLSVIGGLTTIFFDNGVIDPPSGWSECKVSGDLPWTVKPVVKEEIDGFVSQGPPDAIVEIPVAEDTNEMVDVNVVASTTMETTVGRPNIPCKIELGEKFEFCPSDVHEVCRRYIRVVPGTNPDLEQFVVTSLTQGEINQTILNIGVQPQNLWTSLFAAWAGSVKYRFFVEQDDILQVAFAPYYNSDPAAPGVPIVDALPGSNFVYRSIGLTTDSFKSGNLAREMAYPISARSFIDVAVPFQSHFNFCYTTNTQTIAPISSGTLSLIFNKEQTPMVFTAFGDDLRLGVFRPPKITKFDMTVFDLGIAGYRNTS